MSESPGRGGGGLRSGVSKPSPTPPPGEGAFTLRNSMGFPVRRCRHPCTTPAAIPPLVEPKEQNQEQTSPHRSGASPHRKRSARTSLPRPLTASPASSAATRANIPHRLQSRKTPSPPVPSLHRCASLAQVDIEILFFHVNSCLRNALFSVNPVAPNDVYFIWDSAFSSSPAFSMATPLRHTLLRTAPAVLLRPLP